MDIKKIRRNLKSGRYGNKLPYHALLCPETAIADLCDEAKRLQKQIEKLDQQCESQKHEIYTIDSMMEKLQEENKDLQARLDMCGALADHMGELLDKIK